ncbi:hypothetical protein [Streptomyces sp. SLBN-31]|uniref:hypothetical protein n=1 Tax=Streptomyces sp. SLBN-31 TaxID=2768444 RepID=UPI0011518BF7|nr:hypothetical protein [Streptomyces sp. SLBN-31]TQJ90577.1 hypothetical protein FBY22_1364 [Streptomyces sp. SLBN-31]
MKQVTPGRRTQSAVSALPEQPAQWHRVLTLLADISLFVGTRAIWTQAESHRPAVAAVISVCYAAILVSGVLTLVVRRASSLRRLDAVVLVTAVVLALCAWAMNHGGSDEAVLTTQAARELAAGHPVYGQPWPWLFTKGIALTTTFNGGYDFTYGYPPLAPLLTAPLLWIGHGGAPATAVSTGALIVGTVVLWRMLPAPWRPAATMACLGFGFLPTYAREGYPAITALALLIPVVVRWPRIGLGGRLGASGVARAACLGAACAAQQLPWFLAPFLLVGIYALRRGELGGRAAALVVARIVGIAATVWLLINTYFIVSEPGTWATGIALPLIQGATLHGQGLVGMSLYYTHGSDRLDWYGHASMLLAVALLGLLVLFVRRLGPAATVLPWCAFYLATRSQDGYYLMMTPLWLAAAVTAPPEEFYRAWQPRPRLLTGSHRRPALVATALLLVAPALVSAVVAVTGKPPLRTEIAAVRRTAKDANVLTRLTLRVTNTDDSALEPHFMLTVGQGLRQYWTTLRGPASLPAHTTAEYVIRPAHGGFALPGPHALLRLRVFTADPQTLSSSDVRLRVDGPHGGGTGRSGRSR